MGVVINVAYAPSGCVRAIHQVQHAEQNGRYRDRYKQQIHTAQRIKQYICKYHRANSARGPQAVVPVIIFMLHYRGHVAQYQAGGIQQAKLPMPHVTL